MMTSIASCVVWTIQDKGSVEFVGGAYRREFWGGVGEDVFGYAVG